MIRKSIHSESTVNNISKNISSTIPIADSTHIDDSTKNSPSKFAWGGKYSPKKKPSTIIPNSKPVYRTSAAINLINKVDPQVYTDTQSKGLASRIVMYYEKSHKKSKPLSNRMYNRPGEFPIVHLDKKEKSLNLRKSNTSITKVKIAPPDRSIFEVNTRSEILRTGALVQQGTLLKTKDQICRENEPLAPHNEYENSQIPTRSVLDVLKEISRKRINCDDIDGDQIKKQKEDLDTIDAGKDTNTIQVKRQRETTSPNSKNTSAEGQKKRLCTKNNDILSSLSSSLLLNTTKRKIEAPARGVQLNLQSESFQPQNKLQKIDTHELPIKQESFKLPSIPNTPHIADVQKTYKQQITTAPKLTLFNKTYDANVKNRPVIVNEINDDEQCISFVKPKRNSPISASCGKGFLKPVEKSKLSLMLSCISGSLEEDDEDVVDTSHNTILNEPIVANTVVSTTEAVIVANKPVLSFGTTPTNTSATLSTITTTTSVLTSPSASITEPNKIVLDTTTNKPIELNTVNAETTAVVSKEAPELVDKNDTKVLNTISSAQLVTTSTAAIATNLSIPQFGIASSASLTIINPSTISTIPTFTIPSSTLSERKGGFSFPATSATVTLSNKNISTVTEQQIHKPESVATPTNSLFSFGKTTSTSTPSSTLSNSVLKNSTQTYSNLGKTISNTMSIPTPSEEKNLFSLANAPVVFGATTQPVNTGVFSFHTENKKLEPSTLANVKPSGVSVSELKTNETIKTTSSSFGNILSTSNAKPEISTPTFNFGTTKNTAIPTSSFSFGNNQQVAVTAATTSKPFTFGEIKQTNTPLGNNTNSITAAPNTTAMTNTASVFGNPTVAASTASINFGGQAGATTNPTQNLFVHSKPTTSPINFGGQPGVTSVPLFGNQTINSSNQSQPLTFGMQTEQARSKCGNQSTQVFGSQSTTPFGSQPPPAFGSQAAPVFGSQSTPVFGQPSSSVFGGAQDSAKPIIFGEVNFANKTANTTKTNTEIFGGPKQISPGQFIMETMQGPSSALTSSGLFGNVKPTASAAPFTFSSNPPATTTSSSFPSSAKPTASAAPFSFGGTAQTANIFDQQQPQISQTPSTAFNFTGNQLKPTPTTTDVAKTAFCFNGTQNNSNNITHTFGATTLPTTNGNTNTFNVSKPFGYANNPATPVTTTNFAFGNSIATITTTTQQTLPNPFGNASSSTSSAFTFGAVNAGSASEANTSNAFNFTGQQAAPVNLFNAGPSISKNRPIRQATRRMNK